MITESTDMPAEVAADLEKIATVLCPAADYMTPSFNADLTRRAITEAYFIGVKHGRENPKQWTVGN